MRERKRPVHFQLTHSPVHITYRLHGSIPAAEKLKIAAVRNAAIEELTISTADLADGTSDEAHRMALRSINDQYEAALESVLHAQQSDAMYLGETEIRDTVMESWRYLERQREIILYAICVMSNHVHVVVGTVDDSAQLPLGQLMRRHKSHTGRLCNRILGQSGVPFWAPNYFDRTIRDDAFVTVMWYVLDNPVKANLVTEWQAWPGTYVHPAFLSHFV